MRKVGGTKVGGVQQGGPAKVGKVLKKKKGHARNRMIYYL
jgi:hypothetical protein